MNREFLYLLECAVTTVLTPATGPELVATDHDFHIGGLVPSVTLVTDTPCNANDSFFNGKVYVTTDKVFQTSNPFRHATELTRILRDYHSTDYVNLEKSVLCMMTDGGPDHRVTYETVKTSLIQLFMQLDLEMLIAIRTAPKNSWVNPADRCMSLLNLALQHCALDRREMRPDFETKIRHKSSLNAIRNVGKITPALKTAFGESMAPVIEKVNDRFRRMKLKGVPFTTYKGISDAIIDDQMSIIHFTTQADADVIKQTANSKELRECKVLQV